MALRTIGTITNQILVALPAWAASLSNADIASIANGIMDDSRFGSILGVGPSGTTAVLTTASSHTNTTLDTLVFAGGAPLSQIQVGDLVLGQFITPGTYVAAKPSGTSVTLSQAATATSAGIRVAFCRPSLATSGEFSRDGRLFVPNRGVLKLLPGDIVALDNLGFPYLIPGNTIGYAGSQWNLV